MNLKKIIWVLAFFIILVPLFGKLSYKNSYEKNTIVEVAQTDANSNILNNTNTDQNNGNKSNEIQQEKSEEIPQNTVNQMGNESENVVQNNDLPTNSPIVYKKDIEYKEQIIKDSGKYFYKLENMQSIMGEEELTKFIIDNDTNIVKYSPSNKNSTLLENVQSKQYRANLHMHTVNSDGRFTIQELLDTASIYADSVKRNNPNEQTPFIIAITDHNTMEGCKQALEIIQNNPEKYKNLKIVLGIEIYSFLYTANTIKTPIDIHVLAWGINPYNRILNYEIMKRDPTCGFSNCYKRSFQEAISLIQNQKYGLVGIAHPARYVKSDRLSNTKEAYIDELFSIYNKMRKNKILFTEAYYQSYRTYEVEDFALIDFISQEAKNYNILRTGSTDAHGKSLYSRN